MDATSRAGPGGGTSTAGSGSRSEGSNPQRSASGTSCTRRIGAVAAAPPDGAGEPSAAPEAGVGIGGEEDTGRAGVGAGPGDAGATTAGAATGGGWAAAGWAAGFGPAAGARGGVCEGAGPTPDGGADPKAPLTGSGGDAGVTPLGTGGETRPVVGGGSPGDRGAAGTGGEAGATARTA